MRRNEIVRRFGCRVRTMAAGLVLAAGLFLTCGCQTTTEPFTGRPQFILVPPPQELQMGMSAWSQIVKKEKPCRTKWMVDAVTRVGNNLARAADKPEYQWEFRVFESKQANAFCLPGGKVGVYSGLFKYLDNDAELAAVVGHEIGHALARHGAERVTLGILQDLGRLGLSVALKNRAEAEQVRWMAAYAGLTNVGVILPFSRTQEYAADEIGMMLMARAGYDPQAALDFWNKFAAKSKQPAVMEFLSTHPLDAHRIQRLQNILPRAVLEYETAPVRHGYGQTFPSVENDGDQ